MELGIRIQSLEGFRILGAVFRISKRGIPDSTAKIWCNLDSRSKNFPDSGGVVSGQKQATVYSCSRRTNGKFVIEPLKSTCWKISCWLSETLFCRLATYIISIPQRLSIRKIQTVGNTSLQLQSPSYHLKIFEVSLIKSISVYWQLILPIWQWFCLLMEPVCRSQRLTVWPFMLGNF